MFFFFPLFYSIFSNIKINFLFVLTRKIITWHTYFIWAGKSKKSQQKQLDFHQMRNILLNVSKMIGQVNNWHHFLKWVTLASPKKSNWFNINFCSVSRWSQSRSAPHVDRTKQESIWTVSAAIFSFHHRAPEDLMASISDGVAGAGAQKLPFATQTDAWVNSVTFARGRS